MPYYLATIEEKKAHVLAIYHDQSLIAKYDEGILPPYIFNFIRVGWSAIFLFFNFRLISRFKAGMGNRILSNNRELFNWLSILDYLLTGLVLVGLYLAIAAPIRRTNSIILDLALGITVCFICLQLFFKATYPGSDGQKLRLQQSQYLY